MRIVALCATNRGLRFLTRLGELAPQHEIIVFSFREEPWEPPYLEEIRALAQANHWEFHETKHVGSNRWSDFWASADADVMFAVSWRYLIPARVYQRPRLGTFVFHDSLLPAYRGFSPTVWAIVNGEDHTGVTLFAIAEEVDAGDIVDQARIAIGDDETIASVVERVTQSYLSLVERNLAGILRGSAPRLVQDHARATYTCKRIPEDNEINWSLPSREIYNLIRAVSEPYPGAFTYLGAQRLRVWSAKCVPDSRPYIGRIPGRVIEVRPGEGSLILTGDGALLVAEVQVDGGEKTCAATVLNSLGHTVGR